MVELWLGHCYHADIKGHLSTTITLFKDALDADDKFKAAALKRLQEINQPSITNKCHISRKHVEFLTKALEN